MAQQVTNFGRFYTAIREMNPVGDRDEVKRSIVLQYTDGRTESLREMTQAEYDRCCADMERGTGGREKLRKERSATLHLMQRMGVDTSDWECINALCRDPRIAGKDFNRVSRVEHPELRARLYAIERNGGLRCHPGRRAIPPPPSCATTVTVNPIGQA